MLRRTWASIGHKAERSVRVQRRSPHRCFLAHNPKHGRGADWLVDALALHDEVALVAPLFRDPAVLKVPRHLATYSSTGRSPT